VTAFREIEHCWIPMEDGVRLSARLWLPAGCEAAPVPAILECIPYRKRDSYRAYDQEMHPHFAANGYACIRVDLRGTGESEGILLDEYLKQEQDDIIAVLRWTGAQPWSTAKVGMMGISWGGFNSLQVAARRPPELAAIITVCSTDDRYADDVHYMGGCLLAENLHWAAQMFIRSARPPDPALAGEGWRATWLDRLERTPPLLPEWLRHQRRDAYWRHGSVCEDYAAIRCPVYAIGGWADGYSNAVPRLLAGLSVPRKGLVGPWGHAYGHDGRPGPQIGFLEEATRWWDQWLKGIDTGIMDEPMYRVWLQDALPPRASYDTRPGRWVAEESWPSPRIEPRRLHLTPGHLAAQPAADAAIAVATPQDAGFSHGEWCPYGIGPELPADQRADDGRSVCFDSAPLDAPLDLLGAPAVELDVSADRPKALLVARLCALSPDGASSRLTYGVLNLTHRDGHAEPKPLEPGRRYRIRLQLNDLGERIPAGWRLRLALSNAWFPLIWPSPEAAAVTIHIGDAQLILPVRPARTDDAGLPDFAPPSIPPSLATTLVRPGCDTRRIETEVASGERVKVVARDGGRIRIPELDDLEIAMGGTARASIRPDDPLSARIEATGAAELGRGPWQVAIDTRSVLTATVDAFIVELWLEAREGDRPVFHRRWRETIDRDGV
jgi:hypothetical protein